MQTDLLDQPAEPTESSDRDGSRVVRGPSMLDIAVSAADRHGVCLHPVVLEQTDTTNGRTKLVPVPCGATLESRCGPCARKARALRKAQCREGWHATTEPVKARARPTYDQEGLIGYRADILTALEAARESDAAEVAELDAELRWIDEQLTALGMRGKAASDCAGGGADTDAETSATDSAAQTTPRKRSTRRRQDAPDLPRLPVADRTIGREVDGVYSSMFVTLTMPSYGKVRDDGTARDPNSYDYRSAAWDAITCARLFSRWIQNLRRVVGWNVQYFAVVEPQKRGAPHLHIALRGAIPWETIIRVTEATYHQVWWPVLGDMRYPGKQVPVWDDQTGGFLDPVSREPLTDWETALDAIGPTGQPAHKAAFGPRIDVQTIGSGSEDARQAIGYLCKYLTKSVSEVLEARTARQHDHYDRLHAALCATPCNPRCGIWLLYGIVPQGATAKTVPGVCKARAHRRETLALPGNRVLTSEQWTGKTLGDHKADRLEFVRRTLAAVGIDKPPADPRRYTWTPLGAGTRKPSRTKLLLAGIAERATWRTEYEHALRAAEPPGPPDPPDSKPETHTCSAITSQPTDSNNFDLDRNGAGHV
ncbi:replication initiator [Nocardia arizonensis]|uniref:replication initiator n=1 Tax=Nocardia arizonensis TaxID=1141647 RepID=UPI000A42C201|nr:replication initiator [Nocardia arizonensis]